MYNIQIVIYACIHIQYVCMYPTYVCITSMLVNSLDLWINNFQVVENIGEGGSASWVLTPTQFSELYVTFRFIGIWQFWTIRDFP